jgi:fluoride exporter
MLEIRSALAVSLGAVAGALSRYYLGLWITQRLGSYFPYGTFIINISGCLIMGFFTTLGTERILPISPELRLLVAVGFLGSYTTFSSYALDTVNLLGTRQGFVALGYWLGSAFLGVTCLQLGALLARLFHGK